MAVQVKQLIASLGLIEAQTAESDHPFLVILREPEINETDISKDGLISFSLVKLGDPPATTTPFTINCLVQISFDGGQVWQNAYENGTFSAPFNGTSSAITQHSLTDPYVYNRIVVDYTGTFTDSSTVMVRVAASLTGWGHDPWGHFTWGHPGAVSTYTEEWSFYVVDETAPKLLTSEAIDRKTLRLTFDDDMRLGTPDGRARVQTGTSGTWNMSTGGETLTVIVDGGEVQTITFATTSWLIPSAVTSEELATALTALVTGAVAVDDGSSGVYLYSGTVGDTSQIQVTGGTANSLFGYPTTAATGSSEGILDTENYTIDRNNVYPKVAVHLEISSVAFVSGSTKMVDLTCQWEMTPGAPYSVTVGADVADTSNNTIDSDFITSEFSGFTPEWPDDRDAEIKIPQTMTDNDPLKVTRAIINMAQEIEDHKISDIDELWDVWNIDTANAPTIELMLYDDGNPFSDLDLTTAQKGKLVDLLPYIYAQKGLPNGLTSTILALLGVPVTIVPYTQESWRLGVDRLGSDYPAALRSTNAEPYGCTGGGTLTISIDGGTAQTITFLATNFANPATATAKELALVIAAQLTGGSANIFDDSFGARLEVLSSTWGKGGSIQVTGGTFASVIGFNTAIMSGSGGSILGPSTSKMKRTFDLEYSTVVPSDEVIIQMTKIANYMKPVNTHLGRIRPAKTIPTPKYWVLGFNLLGTNTSLGS